METKRWKSGLMQEHGANLPQTSIPEKSVMSLRVAKDVTTAKPAMIQTYHLPKQDDCHNTPCCRDSPTTAQHIGAITEQQSTTKVPFLDLRPLHHALKGELLKAWSGLLDSAGFISGPQVQEFERSYATYCEVKHAVAVGNGTDALMLALRALGIGNGDEVITAANSFVATAEAIVNVGATPVFADINPETYNIDFQQVESKVTRKTKAVIPVHVFGQPADMDPILQIADQHSIYVIEDAAQAHGARYKGKRVGSMGDLGCFSFYPGKNLGACGDAGAVVTNDEHLALILQQLRDHGGITKYQHDLVGCNSRMDTLQAAVLLAKLPDLDTRNETRRAHASTYHSLLSQIAGILTPIVSENVESVFHLYVIQLQNGSRDALQHFLAKRGIQTGIHYPTPIHKTAAFAHSDIRLPRAEAIARTILSLPMYPELQKTQIEYVVRAISEYMTLVN